MKEFIGYTENYLIKKIILIMRYNKCGTRHAARRRQWKNDFINREFQSFFTGYPFGRPAVNISETEEDFKIEIVTPGFDKSDFKLDVDKDLLTISAKVEEGDSKVNYTRREFETRSFKRRFHLPNTVNVDNIHASYDNGILRVALPKKEEAKTPSRTIEVL